MKNVQPGIVQDTLVPGRRADLLALADVRIFQADVIDSQSRRRNVIIWQCGTDVLYAGTMDALFDSQRRRGAPTWLKDQLVKLPASRRFTHDGSLYSAAAGNATVTAESDLPPSEPLAEGEFLDDEIPGAEQA